MRALSAFVLFLGACATTTPPTHVTVAELPQSAAATPVTFGDCHVEGTGERTHGDPAENPPFEIFSARRSRQAELVITEPGETHVTWSEFPSARSDDRARVWLGGQNHIRYSGFSALHGRTFSIKKRFVAEANHLWARPGAPVEMMSFENGVAVARVATPFATPATLAVLGSCDGLAYAPDDMEAQDTSFTLPATSVVALGPTIDFYTSSGEAKPFLTVTVAPDAPIELDVIAKSGDFSHVHSVLENLELDAWVKSSSVDENGIGGLGLSGYGSSSCGGASGTLATLKHDTPLYVGAKPAPLDGASVEAGAQIYVDKYNAQAFHDRTVVSFTFVDRMIEAAPSSQMWIARDAVED